MSMKTLVMTCFAVLACGSVALPLIAPVAAVSVATEAEVQLAAHDVDTVAEPVVSAGHWHRVVAGETLRSVAQRYYGSSRQWRTVQIANGADLHPAVGTVLWIPGLRDEMDGLGEGVVAQSTAGGFTAQ